MLKKLALLLFIIYTLTSAESNSGIWGIGGLSYGNIKGKNTTYKEYHNSTVLSTLSPNSLFAPIFAFGYEKKLLRILSFKMGIGYEIVGNEFKVEKNEIRSTAPFDTLYTFNHNRKFSFSYLNIPLDIKLKLPLGNAGIYSSIGAKMGFLLSAKEELKQTFELISSEQGIEIPYNLNASSDKYSRDIKKSSTNINMSLGFRFGGEIPFRRLHVILESGYDLGLIEVMKEEDLVDKSGIITILSLGLKLNTSINE